MNAPSVISGAGSVGKFPEPLSEKDHLITIRKCDVVRKRLHAVGESISLNLKEAVNLLAPSKSRLARLNVLKLKSGQYIGVKAKDLSNFVIVNPTDDGDIRWLLKKQPDIFSIVRDVYFVESVSIRRNAIDLPMDVVED